MSGVRCLVLAAAGSLGTLVLLWGTSVPLGVPGEWTWERITHGDAKPLATGFAVTVALAAGYVVYATWGARQIESASPTCRAAFLAGLVVAGFVWLLAVQSLPPMPYGLSKSSHVLYLPRSSGYFHEARYGGWTVREFLAGYEARMREGDVLHVGTHPPGLFLVHRGLLELFRASPGLAEFVAGTRPAAVRRVDEELLAAMRGEPLEPADVATLWTATLGTHLVALLSCVPLYLLVRRTAGPRAAWWAAAFWPLLPALGVFLPKSDALLPFVGTLFLWLWLEAVRLRSAWRAVLAGLLVWGGLWISLALLPVGLLALALAIGETLFEADRRWSAFVVAGAVAFGTMLVATLATWIAWDLNLPLVWWLNLWNHAAFYDRHPRTYAAWLVVNPLEFACALGAPVSVLGLGGLLRAVRAAPETSTSQERSRSTRGRLVVITIFAVWALLWLSGKNMGEAARLWLFLAPWPLWGAFATEPEKADRSLPWLLAMQCLVCAATVARVNGFELPE